MVAKHRLLHEMVDAVVLRDWNSQRGAGFEKYAWGGDIHGSNSGVRTGDVPKPILDKHFFHIADRMNCAGGGEILRPTSSCHGKVEIVHVALSSTQQ